MKDLIKELCLYGFIMSTLAYGFNMAFLQYAGYENHIAEYLEEHLK